MLEHDPVPIAGRHAPPIELAEDLRLGAGHGDPAQAFYNPRDVDADADGNVYVLDAGNYRVQVFDADGRFIRTIGRRGQGPGDFQTPRNVVIAGDRMVVNDLSELSVWTLDGELVADYFDITWLSAIYGRPDRLLVADHVPELDVDDPQLSISALAADGSERTRFIRLPTGAGKGPAPAFAAARDGRVYVTGVGDYQVLAFYPDGTAVWALRVNWNRSRPDELPGLATNRWKVPDEAMPALSHLAVDGHGHLYVYLYDDREGTSPLHPVDVYSPEGDLLYTGMIDDTRWMRARGDFVYTAGWDVDSNEHTVVRHRLVEPFD